MAAARPGAAAHTRAAATSAQVPRAVSGGEPAPEAVLVDSIPGDATIAAMHPPAAAGTDDASLAARKGMARIVPYQVKQIRAVISKYHLGESW